MATFVTVLSIRSTSCSKNASVQREYNLEDLQVLQADENADESVKVLLERSDHDTENFILVQELLQH